MLSELYTVDVDLNSPTVLKINPDSLTRTLHSVRFPDSGGGFGHPTIPYRFLTCDPKTLRYTFNQVRGLQPSTIRSATSYSYHNGVVHFVYGLSSGSILVAEVTESHHEEVFVFELQQSSIIQKLFTGLTFSKSDIDAPNTVSDMAFLTASEQTNFIVSVCRDHQLRLWDIKKRVCIENFDLLSQIANSFADEQTRSMQFAPGLYHRIAQSSSPVSSDNEINFVVYLTFTPINSSASQGHHQYQSLASSCNLNYWCWFTLDAAKAVKGDSQVLTLLSIEPVTPSDSQSGGSERTNYWSGLDLIDMYPMHDASSNSCSSSRGVWWLSHQTSSSSGLESIHKIRYSGLYHSIDDPYRLRANGMCARTSSPLARPNLLTDTINYHDTTSGSFDIESFTDALLEPGRYSFLAISNSIKALRESHNLPPLSLLRSFHDKSSCAMNELKGQIEQTLSTILEQLDPDESLNTVLQTLAATITDYHQYGLQPLGLFRLTTSTTTGDEVETADHQSIPPDAFKMVVVRRWGFTLLRSLDACEHLLITGHASTTNKGQTALSAEQLNCIQPSLERCQILLRHLSSTSSSSNSPLHDLWVSILTNLYYCPLRGDRSSNDHPIDLARQLVNALSDTRSLSVVTDTNLSNSQLASLNQLTLLLTNLSFYPRSINDDESSASCLLQATTDDNDVSMSIDWDASHQLPLVGSASNRTSDDRAYSLVGLELASQALLQSLDCRLQLALTALLVTCDGYDDSHLQSTTNDDDVTLSSISSRLVNLIYRLRLLRWLTVTRMPPCLDVDKLSASVWEHLALLGLSCSLPTSSSSSALTNRIDFNASPLSVSQSFILHPLANLAGLTLLQQLIQQLSSPSTGLLQDYCHGQQQQSWTATCCMVDLPQLTARIYAGQDLVELFRLLLAGGRTVKLKQLTRLLLPPDLISLPNDQQQVPGNVSSDEHLDQSAMTDEEEESINSDFGAEPWQWSGDHCLVYLSLGLALLWSSDPESAEHLFLRASNVLKQGLDDHHVHVIDDDCEGEPSSALTTYQLSTGRLFARELGLDSLAGGVIVGGGGSLEVQVRFLMKLMPILEIGDHHAQVIHLTEICLRLLSNLVDQSGRSPDQRSPNTRADTHSSSSLSRLSDLEAALWTRAFKHELALGNYSRAHTIVKSNPDPERRRDCLRQFIVSLCDRGEASRLITFKYGSMESESERDAVGDWAFAIDNQPQLVDDNDHNSPPLDQDQVFRVDGKRLLSLADLLRQQQLVRVKVRLISLLLSIDDHDHHHQVLSCWPIGWNDLVNQLINVALYDAVVEAVASRCSQLTSFLACQSSITEELVLPSLARCSSPLALEHQLVKDATAKLSVAAGITNAPLELTNDGDSEKLNVRLGLLLTAYWRLLDVLLTRLDPLSPASADSPQGRRRNPIGSLHVTACRALLSVSPPGVNLPEWLASRLTSVRPNCLLRLLVGRIEETLTNQRRQVTLTSIRSAYNLAMDLLTASLGQLADPASFGLRMHQNLYNRLTEYLMQLEIESRQIA